MSITNEQELIGMQKVSEAVAFTGSISKLGEKKNIDNFVEC